VAEPLDDTHTTDGEHYRTPAHPLVIAAIGRAMWNFLSLEESVVAILYESGAYDLSDARSLMAGGKENALRDLKSWLEARSESRELLESVQRSIDAFGHARREYRNALSHAVPFTAGYAPDGTYLPGLTLDTSTGALRAHSANELHEVAHRIEDAVDPLSDARSAVRKFVESIEDS